MIHAQDQRFPIPGEKRRPAKLPLRHASGRTEITFKAPGAVRTVRRDSRAGRLYLEVSQTTLGGYDRDFAAVVSGHRDHGNIQMTMRYSHLQPDNDDRAVTAMMSI